jgi:hypothetical protein
MNLSDDWVEAGTRADDPLLGRERLERSFRRAGLGRLSGNDPDAACDYMRRFTRWSTPRRFALDPVRASELEVGWWRALACTNVRTPRARALVESLVALYSHVRS